MLISGLELLKWMGRAIQSKPADDNQAQQVKASINGGWDNCVKKLPGCIVEDQASAASSERCAKFAREVRLE